MLVRLVELDSNPTLSFADVVTVKEPYQHPLTAPCLIVADRLISRQWYILHLLLSVLSNLGMAQLEEEEEEEKRMCPEESVYCPMNTETGTEKKVNIHINLTD